MNWMPYVWMAGRAKENLPGGSLKYMFVYLKICIFKCSYYIYIYILFYPQHISLYLPIAGLSAAAHGPTGSLPPIHATPQTALFGKWTFAGSRCITCCSALENMGIDCMMKISILVGGLEHFYFSICWECHHPIWRTHIFQTGRYTTNQIILC